MEGKKKWPVLICGGPQCETSPTVSYGVSPVPGNAIFVYQIWPDPVVHPDPVDFPEYPLESSNVPPLAFMETFERSLPRVPPLKLLPSKVGLCFGRVVHRSRVGREVNRRPVRNFRFGYSLRRRVR